MSSQTLTSPKTQSAKLFSNVIGQEHVKNQLLFFLKSYQSDNLLPNIMFLAPAGTGKTMLAEELGQATGKTVVTINCAELKSAKVLFENIFLPFAGQQVYFFFDEIQDLKPKISSTLLSITNPTIDNVNTVNFNGMEYAFDFRQISFVAAGTEKHRIFKPLLDRFHEIQLVEYNQEQLAKIIRLYAEKTANDELSDEQIKYEFDDKALFQMASYSRSSGRGGFKLGRHIGMYCKNFKIRKFTMTDVPSFISIFDLFEFGLTRMERDLLKKIAEQPEISLTALCAKTGMTRQAQQEFESFLLRYSLMEIDGKRMVTAKGIEYLKRNDK